MAQNKVLYSIGKFILRPAYKILYRYKIKNKGAIPTEGGVILASNHMSFADPVLLTSWLSRSFSKINSRRP